MYRKGWREGGKGARIFVAGEEEENKDASRGRQLATVLRGVGGDPRAGREYIILIAAARNSFSFFLFPFSFFLFLFLFLYSFLLFFFSFSFFLFSDDLYL